MTVLSNRDILECLGDTVVIDPFVPENVNTSSVDVRLGEWYYVEQRPPWWRRLVSALGFHEVYNIWDFEHVQRVWGEHQRAPMIGVLFDGRWNTAWRGISPRDRVIMLPPKTTILAHTEEFIGGRGTVTSMMKARSTMGRNFIEVCKCAGWGDVGYFNRWTMEITNNSKWRTIPLVVGRRIAQIALIETGVQATGAGDYAAGGKYQVTSDLKELKRTWHPSMMLPRLDKDRDAVSANPTRKACAT